MQTKSKAMNTKLKKSAAASAVLKLMDKDFEYQQALSKVLNEHPNVDKAELENELNLYI